MNEVVFVLKQNPARMKLRWKIGRIIAYVLAKLLFGFQVVGQENLLKGTGQILVSNHYSNIDPFFVALASGQEIYFMAKEELFKISKFFTWLISSWNAIPVARNARAAEALKKCANLLKNNKTVLIFPEGTRNKFEEMLPFKPGCGFLAITNRVPIVPVAILGVRETWNGKLTRFIDRDIRKKYKPKCAKNVTIKFGKIINSNGYSNNREGYEKLTQIIRGEIEFLLKGKCEKKQ